MWNPANGRMEEKVVEVQMVVDRERDKAKHLSSR